MSIKNTIFLLWAGIALAACGQFISKEPSSIASAEPAAEPTDWQKETFGPLVNFVGKTYLGKPPNAGPDELGDIQAWEWAVGGTAMSIRHAIEDGSYGGETLIYHDDAKQSLAYMYVTNAGFATQGTMSFGDDGSWTSVEAVSGHESITEVRSTGRSNPDGALTMNSEYLQNGSWVPGHAFIYQEVTDRTPIVKGPRPS